VIRLKFHNRGAEFPCIGLPNVRSPISFTGEILVEVDGVKLTPWLRIMTVNRLFQNCNYNVIKL